MRNCGITWDESARIGASCCLISGADWMIIVLSVGNNVEKRNGDNQRHEEQELTR